MRFDVMLTTAQRPGLEQNEVFTNAVETAGWAEELGYRGIWMLEHHFTRYGLCNSAITMAAYLLGRTRTLRVGSAITIVPLEHPVKLAERVAMIDQLSGGRFDFGVGRGTYVRDFEAFGADMSVNHLTFLQTMKDVLRAWSDEPYTVQGAAGRTLAALPVNPRPLTRPHPPVFVASNSPDTVSWAASHGFPLLLREGLDDAFKRKLVDQYRQARPDAGRAGAEVRHALNCVAVLDDCDRRARDTAHTHVEWWVAEGAATNGLLSNRHRLPNYRTYFEAVDAGRRAGTGDKGALVDDMLALNLVGSPQRCRARLEEVCETTGVRHVVLGFDANEPGPRTREVMERFMAEVLRPVAARYPEAPGQAQQRTDGAGPPPHADARPANRTEGAAR
ncbi:LLM class flavin-dependent oxidoreductase [Streptomyces sp. NPDC059517]|uniref:LLM class flavin-dependent oxidoreductase n=1 Tax=Streptomyces sp. NPDC059517 TaxID=3346855 RepID=UPI0036AE9448